MSQRVYIETYGCQMNLADSEVIGGILSKAGYAVAQVVEDADVVLLNTCAVRDNAEQRIQGRLGLFNSYKRRNPGLVIGILGCMAERLKTRLVADESPVDLVVGPDEYRKLPSIIERAREGEKGIAVRLSRVENYEDIEPLRTEGISAWISVMRGCDKFCTFCVVPFTRGRERSRSFASVVEEARNLSHRGFKEITLLGQNVNSYRDENHDFADLLEAVAATDRSMRVRFTTSHPQDMSDRLIQAIARNENICKHIHLPVQSGSDRVLTLMNRSYTVDHYMRLVKKIRTAIPEASLSTDIISGFPTESEEDHRMTLDLVATIHYDGAYTFKYSPRDNTKAWLMKDDVAEEEKGRRVQEVTELQHQISRGLNERMVGKVETILAEGASRKSADYWMGRTDSNKTVIFPHTDERAGDYLQVIIHRANSATLFAGQYTQEAAA